MLRYAGYLLVAAMVLALAAGVAWIIVGGMAERLAVPGNVRLVVFDSVAAEGQNFLIRALLWNLDGDRPITGALLLARFNDGHSVPIGTDSTGLAGGRYGSGLGAGRYAFTVTLPDTHPRLDVEAAASIWVRPADVRTIWIDAAAVPAGPGGSGGEPSGPGRQALDAIKVLAVGRQPVYLVAVEAVDYAAMRHRVETSPSPGPAVWVRPVEAASRMAAIRRVWPKVDAALVCHTALFDAAVKTKVPAWRVPVAASAAAPAEATTGWQEAIQKLSGQAGASKSSGGVP